MSDTSTSKRGASPLNSRLLTILFVFLMAVIVPMGGFVILATVGMYQARSIFIQHAFGLPGGRLVAVRNDVRYVHPDDHAALPSQPLAAARDLVHSVGDIQLPCYPHNVKKWYLASLGCPVTTAYRHYLLAHSRDADPVCGCQNYAIRNTFHLLFQRAGLATVAATLTFTYNTLYIVFVEVKRGNSRMVTSSYVTHS